MGSLKDQFFIKETLKLAKKGLSWTNPNPMVGCLIVKDGKVLAKGYHHQAGLPHAEIEALKLLKSPPQGATLYVNLEPCSHWGRTPPCTEAIIKSGISKVVCSTYDPNPKVSGQGVKQLKKAGIKMVVGVLEKQAQALNEKHFTFYTKKRPFVALKFASSLDGKIATREMDSKWITNQKAREFARSLRGQYQAVLVGISTVIKDDPHLGVRKKDKKDPLRIILDPALKIPLSAQALRDDNCLLVTSTQASRKKLEILEKKGIRVLTFKGQKIEVKKLLLALKELDIVSVLVEGGGKTLGEFVDSQSFDKVYAFYAPKILGGEKAVSAIGGKGVKTINEAIVLKNIQIKYFGDNFLVVGWNNQFPAD